MSNTFRALLSAALLLGTSATLNAQKLLTSSFGGTQATDFIGWCADPDDGYCRATGPDQIGYNGFDVTFEAEGIASGYGTNLRYNLGDNGEWLNRAMAATDSDTDWIRFTFAKPVYRVGAIMNYYVEGGMFDGEAPIFIAYDFNDNPIAAFDLFAQAPIFTPNGNDEGAFRGLEYAGGIKTIQLQGSYLLTDNLFVSDEPVSVVPEPSTYALMAAGLVGIGLVRRRKTRV